MLNEESANIPETIKNKNDEELVLNNDIQNELINNYNESLDSKKDPTDTYVSMTRTIEDPKYLKKVQKSNFIKQYLDAPRKDDPLYQDVLNMLLENGYGIEHWSSMCSQILAWQMPIYLTEQNLIAQGITGLDLHNKMEELKEEKKELKEMILKTTPRTTGVHDLKLIQELMNIPLRAARNEAPFGYSGSTTRDGDKILSDDDWMTDTHRHYMEKYLETQQNEN